MGWYFMGTMQLESMILLKFKPTMMKAISHKLYQFCAKKEKARMTAPPSKFKLMPSVALYESTNRLSLIACEMIKRPAFIVKIANLKKSQHLFLQFPWEFFDRTGWCDTSEKEGALHPLPDVLPLPSIILSTEPALTFPQDPCEEIPIRKKPKPKWNYLDPPSGMRILKQYQCKLDT